MNFIYGGTQLTTNIYEWNATQNQPNILNMGTNMMVSLREMTEYDLDFFVEVRNSCAEEFLHDSRTFTVDEAKEWWTRYNENEYYIILFGDVKIGYFRTSNYSKHNGNIYIGADLHKDWRGQGLSYVAYQQFIPFMFEYRNLHKISLEVLATNIRAINLYKKLGFVEEGRKRDEVYKSGYYVDSVIMSIIKEEYYEKI
jgi:RimJ/RimL family protein N-acetyltransferase